MSLRAVCHWRVSLRLSFFALVLAAISNAGAADNSATLKGNAGGNVTTPSTARPLVELGPGDSISLQVFGQPDMTSTVYIGDDGTIPVALVGSVNVAGLSPGDAAKRIEKALLDGKFLLDPHVSITVTSSRSQRVSVLGEVTAPGRFAVESNTTIFDLLAQAGGITQNASDVVYLLRADKDGNIARYPINLKGLVDEKSLLPTQTLQGGDSVYVPKAEQYSIYGEVTTPNNYRVEAGMTVIQAIARAGGITVRGSESRVTIKRRTADGKYKTISAKLGDLVQPGDVIQVKESIF